MVCRNLPTCQHLFCRFGCSSPLKMFQSEWINRCLLDKLKLKFSAVTCTVSSQPHTLGNVHTHPHPSSFQNSTHTVWTTLRNTFARTFPADWAAISATKTNISCWVLGLLALARPPFSFCFFLLHWAPINLACLLSVWSHPVGSAV